MAYRERERKRDGERENERREYICMWVQKAKSHRIQRMPVEKEWVRENERLMLQRGWGSSVMNKNQAN